MATLIKTLTVPNAQGTGVGYTFNATQLDSKTPGYYSNLPLGTCSTAAGTVEKTVTISGFELVNGARVVVKFSNTNSATSPTLNVNGTGAKAIYYNNAAVSNSFILQNVIYEFIYDSSNSRYHLIGFIGEDKKAASQNTSDKIFLIGTTIQSAVGQETFSHDTAYVDTNGAVNSYNNISKNTTPVVTRGEKGIAGGVVPLNSSGLIDSNYLPSYVDDVIEGILNSKSQFTTSTGTVITSTNAEKGKIYVDTNTGKTYRWSGSEFVEISAGSYSTSIIGASSSVTNTAVNTNGNVYLHTIYDNTRVSSHKIYGDKGIIVTSDSTGALKISTTAGGDLSEIEDSILWHEF